MTGHVCGPESKTIKSVMKDIDGIIDELQDSLISNGLNENVNVMLLSDHGMTDVQSSEVINLENHIDFGHIRLCLDRGAYVMILPNDGAIDFVYQQLSYVKGLTVYKKEDIPERYHIKNNRLTLPIILMPHYGYYILAPPIDGKVYPLTPFTYKGLHGYDPSIVKEMRAFMYAFGPAFKTNYTGQPLKQIDHFNLFCHLLDITPPPNNGSWDRVKDYLKV